MRKAYGDTKLFFDRIIALFGFIFILPLFLLITILVAVDSKGPIIFKQKRIGKDGKEFNVFKFRTMTTTHEKHVISERVISENDKRLTRIGKFLRRTKMDELPQLVNVIRGDMSLVGPRPLMPEYMDIIETWEMQKYYVRPGITGLAQVNGNGELSVQERSYYDVLYSRDANMWLDIKILFKTIKVIFRGEKACLVNVPDEKIQELKDYYQPTVVQDFDTFDNIGEKND